ncbi:MAG: tetratricopeptide repeat protein [Flavobacteriaceae bacterium]|tara:strand:- start:1543 stop:2763 length:1221 start_codon:yes stop_codon:yes gene_type:complete
MKKSIFFIICLFFSFSFSQKKELRNANKKFNSGDIDGANDILKSNKEIFENADSKVFNNYVFLSAKILRSTENFEESYKKLKLIESVKNLAEDVSNELEQLASDIVNSAISDNQQKIYTEASKKLYLAYTIDKNAEDYLYYAASSSVNAGDWNNALKLYLELKELNYEGIITKYYVTKIDTGEKLEVDSVQYELYKKLPKEYDQFIKEDTESKFPEIVKNIALIYNQLGMNDEAMSAVSEARKSNPEDVNLILVEANLYIELDEMNKFKELMIEAIKLKPNDHVLFFNLGVVNADQGNVQDARKYYEKAIEINPSYESAYLNLVALILEEEPEIVDKMNSLGTSRADNVKYDVLKKKREDLYRECVPILKKLIEINKDEEAIRTLMNIYGTLGNNEGFIEMKKMID